MKPTKLKIVAVLMAAASLIRAAERPNIVFFIADDMRPRHFNCFQKDGKPKFLTPNIDRLAREGTLMTQMHVCSPVCTPSRYNVLTGRYASRADNGWFKQRTKKEGQTVVEFNTHIIKSDVTLPKLLQKAGYETGMTGKNHVVEVRGLKKFPSFDASAKDPKNVAILKANHDHVCQAMREMGRQFVLGEDIDRAMKRARRQEARGYSYSYDMLGEAACTEDDARRYHLAYSLTVLVASTLVAKRA